MSADGAVATITTGGRCAANAWAPSISAADSAKSVADLGIELLSTGGTARVLAEAGLNVVRVSEVTGHPEILGGRVKTLHPRIHGGLLADRGQGSHLAELREHGIKPIDLVP